MAEIPPICDFGLPAYEFNLRGVDNKYYSLDMIKGPNGFLVMFICNHCPYVLAIMDRLIRDTSELSHYGIGVVGICSNDSISYPDDSFEKMQKISLDKSFPFPYLHDETQEVAKKFDAVCTPDFFGYNSDSKLQYRGRLDCSRKEAGPKDASRDLFEAMVQISKTGLGPKIQHPSMGCSIKWKKTI